MVADTDGVDVDFSIEEIVVVVVELYMYIMTKSPYVIQLITRVLPGDGVFVGGEVVLVTIAVDTEGSVMQNTR